MSSTISISLVRVGFIAFYSPFLFSYFSVRFVCKLSHHSLPLTRTGPEKYQDRPETKSNIRIQNHSKQAKFANSTKLNIPNVSATLAYHNR